MKKFKKSIAKKIGKKILQIIYLLLKPFIPYIIIFVMIFFFIILIIDAIFVSFSDEEGNLTVSESEIESYCESASTDNCDVYVDGEKTGEGVNISSEESAILTNSGFVITVKDSNYIPNNANIIVKDAEGNNYTLSNTERILKKPELTEIEKQVLIFNITKYNESDSITLIKNDGNIIEFIKK